ncbi:MAG: hypothetical protein PHG20_13660 [Geobacteraceae bacterium]|nr:hypothetical protein [Geobacteraceae bacterium]
MFTLWHIAQLQKLAGELNAETCSSGEIQIKKDGKKFLLYLFPSFGGGKVSVPAYFQIKTKMPQPSWPFEVRKNDVLDWIAEHVFFEQDFQVGINEFDSEYFITAENQAWAKRFFGKDAVRTSIATILSNGFHKISSSNRELRLIMYIKSTDDCPSIDLIGNALEKMRHLYS